MNDQPLGIPEWDTRRHEEVQLANEMMAFKVGPVFRYLQECADEIRDQAFQALATADPSNVVLIAKAQEAHKQAGDFVRWIDAAITRGQAAADMLGRAYRADESRQ